MSFNNINEIYAQCYKKTFLFAKSYVHDEMVAEDIVSESIFKLWQLIKSGEVVEFSMPLLVMIVKNKALDSLRHISVQNLAKQNIEKRYQRELNLRISSLEVCDPEKIFSAEIMEIISRTVAKLPKQTQIIFNLSRFEDLSHKEISTKIGLSTKSVEYHINKVLKSLRVELTDYLPFLVFF